MSYDVTVWARRAVEQHELLALLRAQPGMDAEEASGGFTAVRGVKRAYAFELDGPATVDDEDVPHEVTAVKTGVVALYEAHVGGFGAQGTAAARRFMKALAVETDGVFVDEQAGEIWPKSRQKVARPVESRVDLIDVRFELILEDSDAARREIGQKFLEVARSVAPEFLPRRFGGYEPLSGRFDRDGDEGFLDALTAERDLFSTGEFPVNGGYFRLQPRVDQSVGLCSISFTLVKEPYLEPTARSTLIRFVEKLAAATNSFHACLEVTRGAIWTGRSVQFTASSETAYHYPGMGLPPHPVWISYFAGPYLALVADLLPDHARPSGQGMLTIWSEVPQSRDALPSTWPPRDLAAEFIEDDLHPGSTPDIVDAAVRPAEIAAFDPATPRRRRLPRSQYGN